MDQLFGDATTAMPTPQQHAEIESLLSASRSPIPSLDISRRPGNFTVDSAIPGLDINPPDDDAKDGRKQDGQEGVGGWISRMVNRGKRGSDAGAYKPLGGHDG